MRDLTNWGFQSYQGFLASRRAWRKHTMDKLPDGFKKQETGDYWKPDKGSVITGKVVDVIEGQYGKQHVIQADNGDKVITPSHAMLQALLVSANKGREVIIECIGHGDAKPGQSAPILYEVAVK